MALHRVELQVTLEVLGVEPGDGKAVTKASLCGEGGREGGRTVGGVRPFYPHDEANKSICYTSAYQRSPRVLANLWRRSGGVHVAEEVLDPPKGDATTRVTDLQRGHGVFRYTFGGVVNLK